MLVHNPVLFKRLPGTRMVAKPEALDALPLPAHAIALRFAPDELYITFASDRAQSGASFSTVRATIQTALLAADPHAIIIAEGAFSGAWVAESHALALLERLAEWEMPTARPAFAQGAVAGIPTKLWFEEKRVLFVVPTPYAHELEERLA